MVEDCERRVAELLASIDNLPSSDVDAKFAVLIETIKVLKEEIEDLQGQLDGHVEDYEHKEKPFWELEKEAQP